MFIENVYKGKLDAWRYILGVFLIVLVYFMASMPFGIALMAEAGAEKVAGMSETEMLSVLDPNTTLFYMFLPFVFTFFGILVIVRFLHDQPLKFLFTSRSSFDWSRVVFSFLLVSIIAVLSFLIDIAFSPDDYAWNYDPERFLGLVLIAVLMIPLQTTAEEILMRGYLFQGLGAAFKSRLAPLLITSISFGFLHALNPEVAKLGYGLISIYVITGLFLGMITLMDEGLELSIGFHAANNLVIALLVTSDWTAFQTNSIYKDVSDPVLAEYIIFPVIIYSLIGFIFSKKYKWSSWKSKLTGPVSISS